MARGPSGTVWRHRQLSQPVTGECYGPLVGRGQASCQHPTMCSTALHNKELAGPKYQSCRGGETPLFLLQGRHERQKLLTLHSLPQKRPSRQSEFLFSLVNVSSRAGLPSGCASTRYGALASGRPQLPMRPAAQTPEPVPPMANSYTHCPGVLPKYCPFPGLPSWDER